ncbi:MAG: hypothetical protein NTZ73_02915 [Candidatus Diapherotrites archaeon]|nr:hypothetical protein [Candidatus Diapherotrites archaeon]
MISGKGFLFTVSVIFFTSTLVFYTQQYVENNFFREEGIINSSKLASQPFLNNDISFDLQRIFGFTLETEYSKDLNIKVTGTLPRGFDVQQKLSDYNAFLYGTFFGRTPGTKTIDLANLADGKAELFIGSLVECDFDYDNNVASVYPKTGSTLRYVDLNIDANAIDFNRVEWVGSTPEAGDVLLKINYVDNRNSFSINTSIGPTAVNKLAIVYNAASLTDINAYVTIGDDGVTTSAVKIDTDASRQLDYSLFVSYLASPDTNYLPIRFNAGMTYSERQFSSNSPIKVGN